MPGNDHLHYMLLTSATEAAAPASAVETYRIWLGALPATPAAPTVDEGWFCGERGQSNSFLYSRSRKENDAATLRRGEAIVTVRKMRDLGYPAKCVPPITETY